MAHIVNIPTQLHKPAGHAELIRVRQELAAIREQFNARLDALDAMVVALGPAPDNAARYQRHRRICSDRAMIRDFLDGGD